MDCDVINDGIYSGVLADSKNFVFVNIYHQIGQRSRKGMALILCRWTKKAGGPK